MNKLDAKTSWVNTHVGRAWNEIDPNDRLFMIWGHSHLFGSKNRYLKILKRNFKDVVLGIKRVSAYDLTDENLERIFVKLNDYDPNYVIGYGSCLAGFAKFLNQYKKTLKCRNLKAIVNTSEPLAEIDIEEITRIFQVPVINEYGMAETGVIGYSKTESNPIYIFWNDFIAFEKNNELITTIGEKCFNKLWYRGFRR